MGRADEMSKASETTGVRYLGAGEKARTQSLMETEDVR